MKKVHFSCKLKKKDLGRSYLTKGTVFFAPSEGGGKGEMKTVGRENQRKKRKKPKFPAGGPWEERLNTSWKSLGKKKKREANPYPGKKKSGSKESGPYRFLETGWEKLETGGCVWGKKN